MKEKIIQFIKNTFPNGTSKQTWRETPKTPCSVNTVVRKFGSWNKALQAANVPIFKHHVPLTSCPICGTLTKRTYCSIACANKHKRKLKNKCFVCSTPIHSNLKFCKTCFNKNKKDFAKLTKKEASNNLGKRASKYSQIRENARAVCKNRIQCCAACGYSKHVEVCHILSIKNFPNSALVSQINHPNNLILLCRNCHWELDHNMLRYINYK